jgi:aryl-alcohol dehydrogenase-like predicted oxidoreductase
MKYRLLGRSGVEVSEIGVGSWAMGSDWGDQPVEESIRTIHRAIETGVNFIDTAAGYGDGRSEQVIAKALEQKGKGEVLVATKIHPVMPGAWPPSPYCQIEERYPESYLEQSLQTRLKNLRTDCIDLLQLHTWTRAWNQNPAALEWLQKQKKRGTVRLVGVSTPEHDQNSVIDLMREGLVDAVQVIYNLFEQEPSAELLPVAHETGTGVIVRVAFDESSLAGRFSEEREFSAGDFRSRYFAGDRKARTAARVRRIEAILEGSGYTLREAAGRFVLDHEAVSTVITGVRSPGQMEQNAALSDLEPLPLELVQPLRQFNWLKGFWYGGK